MPQWVQHSREVLFRAGVSDRGWGYRLGGAPAVEPSVLCCLALLATDPQTPDRRTAGTVKGAAGWLANLQQKNGAVGVAPGMPEPGWPTAHALLLWATQQDTEAPRRKAVEWLLQSKGVGIARDPDDPVGHDTALIGWPWVRNTHSWLEPTAMAVLALRREGLIDHPRVQEGLKVILDRPVPTGGWNYGNTSVFGNALRAQPAPTGQALLALAGLEQAAPAAEKAVAYLHETLPGTRAPRSLGFGLLGLTAWGRRPADADTWLEKAYEPLVRRREPPYLLAMLLLAAAGDAALPVLGLAAAPSEKS